MLKKLDFYLNSVTMYRLVLNVLLGMVAYSFILVVWGKLSFEPLELVVSLLILVLSCLVSNQILAKIFKVITNAESATITALILFLILEPSFKLEDIKVLVLVGAMAMTSKYLLAIKKKHLFNPAGASLVLLSFLGIGNGIWWIATPALLPVAFLGLLVVRKIRKANLFFSFLIFALGTMLIQAFLKGQDLRDLLPAVFMSWPLIFFGTIMLTEPLTSPVQKKQQVLFGSLVGILFGSQFQLGAFYSSPELSLIIGNLFAFLVSSNDRQKIKLKEIKQLTSTIYEFVFWPMKVAIYKSGQYAELTLGHKSIDSRGNRRYFTIASSPHSKELRFGIRIRPDGSSSFKKAMLNLKEGDGLAVTQIGGDFVLPSSSKERLVFLAGGVGITPFCSMTRQMLDLDEKRDVILIYLLKNKEDYAYQELFELARTKLGMRVFSWLSEEKGDIEQKDLQKMIPDFKERTFYLSGPNLMVEGYKKKLLNLGVWRGKIKTDYFPGY